MLRVNGQPLESIDTIFSSPDKNKIGTGEDVLSRSQPLVAAGGRGTEDKAER
jgi:hypothetical protein